jgi:hypothetical protein
MNESYLNRCRCGGEGQFMYEDSNARIFARCALCGIRTPSKGASLEVAAKQQVADIWNCGAEQWTRWIKPAVQGDGYPTGARVSHNTGPNGSWEHWISHFEGLNVHEPGVSGWTLIGPAPTE